MKYLMIFALSSLTHLNVYAQNECRSNIDTLVVGDSQVGATWSRSYVGNFLANCLQGDFVIYGRGATIPGNWFGLGGMDQIETIQRDQTNQHLNLGSKEQVPLCKKRLEYMLKDHTPKKLVMSFGGNYNLNAENVITQQMNQFIQILKKYNISRDRCFFITPTFEMQVRDRRNVPSRTRQTSEQVHSIISKLIEGHCQTFSGVKLMQDSIYFDGKELLLRVPVNGRNGCMGAAENDNVHICGMAALDYAEKICQLLN